MLRFVRRAEIRWKLFCAITFIASQKCQMCANDLGGTGKRLCFFTPAAQWQSYCISVHAPLESLISVSLSQQLGVNGLTGLESEIVSQNRGMAGICPLFFWLSFVT